MQKEHLIFKSLPFSHFGAYHHRPTDSGRCFSVDVSMLIKITCDSDWGLMEANREIKREKVREMMAREKKMSCFSSSRGEVYESKKGQQFHHILTVFPLYMWSPAPSVRAL